MAGFGESIATLLFHTLAAARALTTVSYLSLPEPAIDVTTGEVTQGGTLRTYQMRVADFGRNEVDGVVIVAGDRRAMLPVPSFIGLPTIRDRLTIDGDAWDVIAIMKSANEGQWVWHLRKAGVP